MIFLLDDAIIGLVEMTGQINFYDMKKLFLTLAAALIAFSASADRTLASVNKCEIENPYQIQQINDSTLLYKNVDKIQIISNEQTTTKVYDNQNNVIYKQSGSFTVQLPQGDYTIVSDHKFTAARYKKVETLFRY